MSFLAPVMTFLGINFGIAPMMALSEPVSFSAPSEESALDSFILMEKRPRLAKHLCKQFGNANAVIGLLNTHGFLSNNVAAAFRENLEAKPRITDVIVERLRQIVVNAVTRGEKNITLPKGEKESYLHRYIEGARWKIIDRSEYFTIVTEEEAPKKRGNFFTPPPIR